MLLFDTFREISDLKIRFGENFTPLPKVSEREKWKKVNPVYLDSTISKAEDEMTRPWNNRTLTQYVETFTTGVSSFVDGDVGGGRLLSLIMAECMENKGRFINKIADVIWFFCEQTDWIDLAHLNHCHDRKKNYIPDIEEKYRFLDLHTSMTAGTLAWAYYFFKDELDKLTPLLCKRLKYEVKRKVFDTFLIRKDFGWMGFVPSKEHKVNNWNPFIVSHVLECALILGEDEEFVRDVIETGLLFVDNYLNVLPDDGGCDEGPGYWTMAGGSVFDCLEILYYATDGKYNLFNNDKIRKMAEYIENVHIHDDKFVNFADARPRTGVPVMLCRYGKAINNEGLYRLGCSSAGGHGSGCKFRYLEDLFEETIGEYGGVNYIGHSWLPDSQIGTAREKPGDYKGFYLAFKGGHNDESHNHNDVGSFIVFLDAMPVCIDLGCGTYVKETFSPQRYELFNNQSAYHNLPTVNGYMQQPGSEYAAAETEYKAEEKMVRASMSLKNTYSEEAGIEKWKRTYELDRVKGQVSITDDYELKEASDNIVFSLMTNKCPEITGNTIKIAVSETSAAYIDFSDNLTATVEKRPLDEISDGRIKESWGEVYRILLKQTKCVNADVVKIIFHR